MTRPPPPRYRVVEQGRRLVVIDTQTGTPATRQSPAARLPSGPERAGFDGRATLVTHPLYDDKAPRTLTLDPGATQLIEKGRIALVAFGIAYAMLAVAFPWLLFGVVPLFDRRVRTALRRRVTRWVDRYDSAVGIGAG